MLTNRRKAAELEKIRKAHGGILRPPDVVKTAQNPKHPLHECFEWDNTRAASEYRLWQARHLISVCVVLINGNTKPVRTYVSLKDDRAEDAGGYRHVVDVLSDEEAKAQMLLDALADLNAIRRKYRGLKELTDVFNAIDRVRLDYGSDSAQVA